MAATSSAGRTSAASISSNADVDDGRILRVWGLVNPHGRSPLSLTNPEILLTYNGLVPPSKAPLPRLAGVWFLHVVEGLRAAAFERHDGRWHAGHHRGRRRHRSRRASPSGEIRTISPTRAAAAQRSPAHAAPHGRVDVPRTGFVVAANLQHLSGKPWAATAHWRCRRTPHRVLLEPRGSRRLSAQSLLDLRLSRPIRLGGWGASSCSSTCSMC